MNSQNLDINESKSCLSLLHKLFYSSLSSAHKDLFGSEVMNGIFHLEKGHFLPISKSLGKKIRGFLCKILKLGKIKVKKKLMLFTPTWANSRNIRPCTFFTRSKREREWPRVAQLLFNKRLVFFVKVGLVYTLVRQIQIFTKNVFNMLDMWDSKIQTKIA